MDNEKSFLTIVQSICNLSCLIVLIVAGWGIFLINESNTSHNRTTQAIKPAEEKSVIKQVVYSDLWNAPDSTKITLDPNHKLLEYGKELIAHTARYIGPKGTVMAISNGMNCRNCHLHSGTQTFGNNYAAVASTYPKFRARSGTIESIEKRVNDCIERSLNGKKLEDDSPEMKAIVAYIQWVGKDVSKGTTPKGSGIWNLALIERAADPKGGKIVYRKHCERCHADGKGVKDEDGIEWKYPPLHGKDSYTIGAGLYRLSRFAGFVKMNMPYGTTYTSPVLTDEEAWDVAAYINSLPRPSKDISSDWPDISQKPFDHPFGPYADTFSENQHKYGPYTMLKNKN